ncbi:hypothetical protein LMG22931_07056 [Paraburkholderia nemoris]|nr:hypothetical protein LMG22931_07056 [Paraburkholderia nemoris]
MRRAYALPSIPPTSSSARADSASFIGAWHPLPKPDVSHFILALTENDATVADTLATYDSLRDSPVRYVGFKDIGLPIAALKQLAQRIRADGPQGRAPSRGDEPRGPTGIDPGRG